MPAPRSTPAILYTRVSTDEQADRGYSLRDQEARLRQHCQRQGMEVLAHFQDDASAKSFDRPGWNALLDYIASNKAELRLRTATVLIVKWDRFSRDATGALSMIRHLRDELGLGVQAVEQPIDFEVPEQLMMLAIYVAAPEVENRRRSLATKAGMRRAMREGRYVSVPPKGYQRGYDDKGFYLIVPGPDAEFVRRAFQMALNPATPADHIRRQLASEGFKCSPNQFLRLLKNPLYMSKIEIPAWRGEPAAVVEGVHEALVDEHTFERVQRRFEKPRRGRSRKFIPSLWLRAHLVCPECGAQVTGSVSKGNGGAYAYYHCQPRSSNQQPTCGAWRVKPEEAHAALSRYLHAQEVAPEMVALVVAVFETMQHEGKQQVSRRRRALEEQAVELEDRLFRCDEKYLDGRLPETAYARLRERYEAALRQVRFDLGRLEAVGEADAVRLAAQVRFAGQLVSSLGRIYDEAGAELRHELIGSIFPGKLSFDGKEYRTREPSRIIDLFRPKTHKKRHRSPSEEAPMSSGCPVRIRT